jgi:predicted Mrr-cat superfamily restriction endonuclease
VSFNVNWAAQEIPFPRFGHQLRDDQSAKKSMDDVEKKVNAMIGEYTMNEYKVLVEIGPEGWTPTQQPPESTPSPRLLPCDFYFYLR